MQVIFSDELRNAFFSSEEPHGDVWHALSSPNISFEVALGKFLI